jgi:protein-tyrosine-phosphatase
MASSVWVLHVCTHNRTRSVLMANLFQQHADLAGLPALTKSGGFSEKGGEEPTDNTVRYLANRGIDVSGYRSHWMTDQSIRKAHIVVTAEQAHVIRVAGRWPDVFGHTFTLPELVQRGEAVGPRNGRPLQEWIDEVNIGRPAALDYLDTPVGEIDDPTGRSPATWKAAFDRIDDLTARMVALLA